MPRSLLPHGLYSLGVVFLATSGWFASLWEGDGCNYAVVTGPIVNQLDPSYTHINPVTTLQLGFDSFREPPYQPEPQQQQQQQQQEDGGGTSPAPPPPPPLTVTNVTDILLPNWSKNRTLGCKEYPDEVTLGIMDSSWNTSRVFAFLGLVLGGAGTTFLFFSICFVFSKVTWRWTGYELFLAVLCQTISLVTWFQTQLCSWNTCGLSRGSKCDIVAVGLWTVSGLMIVCHYPDPNNNNNNNHDTNFDYSSDDGGSSSSGNKNKNKTTNSIGNKEGEIEGQHQRGGQSSGEEGHNDNNNIHRRHNIHIPQHHSDDNVDHDDHHHNSSYDSSRDSSHDKRRYTQVEIN